MEGRCAQAPSRRDRGSHAGAKVCEAPNCTCVHTHASSADRTSRVARGPSPGSPLPSPSTNCIHSPTAKPPQRPWVWTASPTLTVTGVHLQVGTPEGGRRAGRRAGNQVGLCSVSHNPSLDGGSGPSPSVMPQSPCHRVRNNVCGRHTAQVSEKVCCCFP